MNLFLEKRGGGAGGYTPVQVLILFWKEVGCLIKFQQLVVWFFIWAGEK
jgi:hypothetical protein